MSKKEIIARRIANLPSSRREQVMDWVREQKDIINLAAGDPDIPTPDVIIDYAHKALDTGFTHYTDYYGLNQLRNLISKKLEESINVHYDPETEILVTCGVQEGIYIAVQTLLESGEEALIPSPHYAPYYNSVIVARGIPVLVEVKEEDSFILNARELLNRVTLRSKIIIFGNPCNPMGIVWPRECLEQIADIATKHDLYVISDEIYEDFIDGEPPGSIASLPGMRDRTIIINGFSKIYSMTGFRIGYLAGPADIISYIKKLHYNIVLCPNSISQEAAIGALLCSSSEIDKLKEIFKRRRETLWEEMEKLRGISCVKPTGGLYAFPNISSFGLADNDFVKYLAREAGVLTLPGTEFGKFGEGHIRLSLCTSEENIREGIRRINEAVRVLF